MEEIIKRYLSKSPPYSLMIDGGWGSGKTFYIKNSLKDIIEKEKKQMIYTTANGISSFSEIKSQILLGNYNLSHKGGEVIRLVYELGKESLAASDKFKYANPLLKSIESFFKNENVLKYKNKVIVIDDIERIHFEKLKIDEFIGQINSLLTEHHNINVILVGAEQELKNKIGEQHTKMYEDIKEKSIWRTLKFENDIDKILPDLIHDVFSNHKYKTLIEKETDFILDLIRETKEVNLRNVNSFIEITRDVIDLCAKEKVDTFIKSIIYFCYVVSKEYKDGKIKNEEHYDVPDYIKYFEAPIGLRLDLGTGNPINKNNQRFEIYSRLSLKYINLYNYFPSIYHYICNGELNEVLFKKEIEELQSKLEPKKESNIQFNYLFNFRSLTDDEFRSVMEKVVRYIKEGEYNLYYFLQFIRYNIFFIEKSVNVEFKNVDSLIDFSLEHIDKVSKYPAQITSAEIKEFNQNSKKYPKLKSIQEKYKEIIDFQIANKIKERGMNLLKELMRDVINFDDVKFNDILTTVEANEMEALVSKYLSDNAFASMFTSKIRDEWYLFSSERDKINPRSNLLELLQIIKTEISPNSILLKLYVNELEEAITNKIGMES